MTGILKRLLRDAADGKSHLAPDLLFLAALERIDKLERAIEPFAATANLIATATPDRKVLRFGFAAAKFRTARSAYLEPAGDFEAEDPDGPR
jgi:hypothetical protein